MQNVKFLLPTLKITCCTGRQWKLLITHQNPDVSLYLMISLSCHHRLFLYMFFWPSVWLDRWRWRRTCSQVTQVSCQGASKFSTIRTFYYLYIQFYLSFNVGYELQHNERPEHDNCPQNSRKFWQNLIQKHRSAVWRFFDLHRIIRLKLFSRRWGLENRTWADIITWTDRSLAMRLRSIQDT